MSGMRGSMIKKWMCQKTGAAAIKRAAKKRKNKKKRRK